MTMRTWVFGENGLKNHSILIWRGAPVSENAKELNETNEEFKKIQKKKKSTAPGIPRRSPIQVLTGLDVA